MRDLLDAARAVRERAYAPYSGFKVGCALRGESGRIHVGCNVENAAYPHGQCAERGAIAALIAAGDRRIAEVLVIGSGPAPCAPCGGCRQSLNELAPGTTPVHLCAADGEAITRRLDDLLPLAFGPEDLGTTAPASDRLGVIRGRAPGFAPAVGLVLGSGLGRLVEAIEVAAAIPYGDIPGFPRPSVEGHAGRLVLGRLEGVPVACLEGRVHLYEGHPAAAVNTLIRTLKDLGCHTLLLTNAAGSLRAEVPPGSLVAIADHINMLATNPLVGHNDAAYGPRFVDLSEVYDSGLRAILLRNAEALGIGLESGVYLATLGPCFETPAEIRAFRALGADLVGMSTVPEAISARHAGLRVAALSIVTNLAAGMDPAGLSHDQTLTAAGRAAPRLTQLITASIRELAHYGD